MNTPYHGHEDCAFDELPTSEESLRVDSEPRPLTPKLTRRQAAIIGAFTGVSCGPFGDIHEYVDSLPGFKGIGTISFASKEVWEQIKRACREDFLAICSDKEDPK